MKNQKQVNQVVEELLKLDHKGLFDVIHNFNTVLEKSGVPNPIKPGHLLQLGMVFGLLSRLHNVTGK